MVRWVSGESEEQNLIQENSILLSFLGAFPTIKGKKFPEVSSLSPKTLECPPILFYYFILRRADKPRFFWLAVEPLSPNYSSLCEASGRVQGN